MDKSRGFTLLELIIVLAILSVVASMSMPVWQRWAINGNLKTAALEIFYEFALLKEKATGDNRTYRMELDVNNQSYSLQRCDDSGSPCSDWTTFETKSLAAVAGDIVFDAEKTTVSDYRFQTRGTVTMGTIGLKNRRNSTATITVNITGRARMRVDFQ